MLVTIFKRNILRNLIFIVFILFNSIGFGQLIYQKPDLNRINRANSQVEVAALLIDVDIDFFEESSLISLNGEEAYELIIQVQDAKRLNVYFDFLKINKTSTLKVYNESEELVTTINSHSNPNDGLYAIQPYKGSLLRFVFKGNKTESKILIGEVGFFLRSFDDIVTSGFCEVDVSCSEGTQWSDQKNGVVLLLLRTNSSVVYCSGTLINNTARNCIPYVLSADHCIENISANNLQQSSAYFNYENSLCNLENANLDNFILGMTFRASSSFNNGSDLLLLELNKTIPSDFKPFFNGWNKSESFFSSGASIHHPKGNVKKISTYNSNLLNANQDGLTEDAYWEVTWAETINGHGVTETGSSGAPIFNQEKLVVGALSVGTSFCNKPEDPDYYGKLSYSWNNQLDSSKRLDVWLDPLQTDEEYMTGSYFPCNDTTESYVPIDSISVHLNLVSDKISLLVEQSVSNSVHVNLYDISGKIVANREELPSNITLVEFSTKNMEDGMYVLVVEAGGNKRVFKIIVVN